LFRVGGGVNDSRPGGGGKVKGGEFLQRRRIRKYRPPQNQKGDQGERPEGGKIKRLLRKSRRGNKKIKKSNRNHH